MLLDVSYVMGKVFVWDCEVVEKVLLLFGCCCMGVGNFLVKFVIDMVKIIID